MKQFFKYSLIALLAGLIFYGGAGVNWVTACCENCFNTGLDVSLQKSCCASAHEDSHQAGMDMFAFDAVVDGAHDCGIERVEFKWTSLENDRTLVQLPVIADFVFTLSTLDLLTHNASPLVLSYVDNPPPLLSPREYLTLLTTLLI